MFAQRLSDTMRVLLATVAAVALALLMVLCMAASALGKEIEETVTQDGFTFHLYMDEDTGAMNSLWLEKYTGSETEITLPSAIVYKGKEYPVEELGTAFKGNTKITKVIIPKGYAAISEQAFYGCTNLQSVDIANTVSYLGNKAFAQCEKLKTYRIGYNKASDLVLGTDAIGAIGTDDSGKLYTGITAYVAQHSATESAIQFKINSRSEDAGGGTIKVAYLDDPTDLANVKRVITIAGSGSGSGSGSSSSSSSGDSSSTDPAKQMGADGTALGKGASSVAADKTLVAWKSEADPKGSVFNGLQLKMGKVTKTSIKIVWHKVPSAKKYVVYAAKCGTAFKKFKELGGSKKSLTVKKVAGKKVKKGTYYKFIVVALDKSKNVVSTSKTVHIATKGGKVGNDKKVTVKKAVTSKAKKLKKGKSLKLKAKAVPQSKKLKVNRHRKIKYESTNPKVAKVSSSGKITAKKKGTAYVYAYAQDGVAAKVKVTVK